MKSKKVYSIDIDTKDGYEIRDLEFKSYDKAKKKFDKYIELHNYEDSPIDNIQLVAVGNNGDYEILESKFY